jgi:RNA polymerase sigma factor (sigma-70 family)
MTHEATDGEIQEAAGKAVAWMSKRLDTDTWRSLGVDREDAMQEAVVAACLAAAEFDGSAPMSAWLFLKAKFGLQDYVRALRADRKRRSPSRVVQAGLDDEEVRWVHSEVFLDDEDCEIEPESKVCRPDVEAPPSVVAIRSMLDTMLAGVLEDRERQVVAMSFGYDGKKHTHAQIAEEIGLSRSRVTEIFNAAMTKLRAEAQADRIMDL